MSAAVLRTMSDRTSEFADRLPIAGIADYYVRTVVKKRFIVFAVDGFNQVVVTPPTAFLLRVVHETTERTLVHPFKTGTVEDFEFTHHVQALAEIDCEPRKLFLSSEEEEGDPQAHDLTLYEAYEAFKKGYNKIREQGLSTFPQILAEDVEYLLCLTSERYTHFVDAVVTALQAEGFTAKASTERELVRKAEHSVRGGVRPIDLVVSW